GPATVNLTVRAAQAHGALAAPLWARMRIEELEAERELNRGEIRRLGRAFRLVTRETSLIVLDRVEDYARWEIAPPPELRAAYEQLVQLAAQRAAFDRRSHLEQVARSFEQKVAWWNRNFPKDERPVPAKPAPGVAGPAVRNELSRDRAHESSVPAAPASGLALRAAPEQRMLAGRVDQRKAADDAGQASVTIKLQRWQPDAPYVARMRDAPSEHLYRVYLD